MKYDDTYLRSYGIEYSGAVPFDVCAVINERKYGALKKQFAPRSVIVFLVPYYAGEERRNISKYAISRDYHLFMRELFERACPALSEKYSARFRGYADSAPINEVKAAAYAGLGMLGDNGMLINAEYGSYVFIGAIYTDAEFEYEADGTEYCIHCGKCRAACPMRDGRECLSAVTQKKGDLTDGEIAYIRQYGSAWGCDICGDVCPFSVAAVRNKKTTPIGFFYKDRTPFLTREMLDGMTDERFSERAYAWRGKAVTERNLALFEVDRKSGDDAES